MKIFFMVGLTELINGNNPVTLSKRIIRMKLTAIIENGENGWLVGQIEEIPAVISQGKSIEELKGNLVDALYLYLDTQKELTDQEYAGKSIIREELILA
jgi:predicted RNase H-like HicB family nuclease